jgi:hypothetical protein
MAFIEVDVDLDDFDTHELCQELISRMRATGRKGFSDPKKRETLYNEMKELFEALGLSTGKIEVKTLEDKIKLEHIANVWGCYSAADFQQRLPEC